MADPDTITARIPASCPASISQILYHAWHHDLAGLKPLLNVPGRASVQEPTTGETPLHAAIRACAPVNRSTLDDDDAEVVERAKAVVHELFMSGAIWNDVDDHDETPACIAERLGLKDLYALCVGAGVRAELLFGLLNGYEQLDSDDEDSDEEEEKGQEGKGEENIDATGEKEEEEAQIIVDSDPDRAFVPRKKAVGPDVNSADYLRSSLTYSDGKLVDSSQNGVMSTCLPTPTPTPIPIPSFPNIRPP